jgi:hypothetical protein
MIQELTRDNVLPSLNAMFGVQPRELGNVLRYEIRELESSRKLAFEIAFDIPVGNLTTCIVSVYSANTFLQLHGCTGFLTSELLEQTTFFGKNGGHTSGLIIEKNAGCSFYANVNDLLLKGDFTKLAPELMMCSVALSLTDTLDNEGFSF